MNFRLTAFIVAFCVVAIAVLIWIRYSSEGFRSYTRNSDHAILTKRDARRNEVRDYYGRVRSQYPSYYGYSAYSTYPSYSISNPAYPTSCEDLAVSQCNDVDCYNQVRANCYNQLNTII